MPEIKPDDIVKVIHDHPWAGERARVLSGPSGALKSCRCAIIRDDAMDGHEFYAPARNLELVDG